jgi:hypothetical protein
MMQDALTAICLVLAGVGFYWFLDQGVLLAFGGILLCVGSLAVLFRRQIRRSGLFK